MAQRPHQRSYSSGLQPLPVRSRDRMISRWPPNKWTRLKRRVSQASAALGFNERPRARKSPIDLISFGLCLDAHHGRSPRRVHALLDAVARTADQRKREGHDRQDARLLISRPSAIQARLAVDGKGERAKSVASAVFLCVGGAAAIENENARAVMAINETIFCTTFRPMFWLGKQ